MNASSARASPGGISITLQVQPPGPGQPLGHGGCVPSSGKCATPARPHTTLKIGPPSPSSNAYASSSVATRDRPCSSWPVMTRRTMGSALGASDRAAQERVVEATHGCVPAQFTQLHFEIDGAPEHLHDIELAAIGQRAG